VELCGDAVKRDIFEEMLGSVREAGAILRGRQKASRRKTVASSGVRMIREGTSLSQSELAELIGVSVKTLQNWEQERRRPTGPAAALSKIMEYDPGGEGYSRDVGGLRFEAAVA
jgi:putative transcriptional regulator